MLASEVLTHAAKVYLNDSAQVTWTNVVLLPMLTQAVLELEGVLRVNGIDYQRKVTALPIDVAIDAVTLAQYPTDFISPIELRERADLSTGEWSDPITEVEDIDPNIQNETGIICWAFVNNLINFNPPQTAREILLTYTASLTSVTAVSSIIDIPQSKSYLAVKTAELAARNIGNNPTKADALVGKVGVEEDKLIAAMVKDDQGVGGTRRKGYRSR